VIIWFPVEMARLNFGYKGNINETVSFCNWFIDNKI
jgi:hypothetical protein